MTQQESVDPDSEKKSSPSPGNADLSAADILDQMREILGQVEVARKQIDNVVAGAQTAKDALTSDLGTFIAGKKKELKKIRKGYDMVVSAATAKKLGQQYDQKAQDERGRSKWHAGWFYVALVGVLAWSCCLIFGAWNEPPRDAVSLGLVLLRNLPLYAPVIWFACYKNHLANVSKRLAETYAHKSLMAKTFTGMAEQIREIAETDASLAGELKHKMLEALIRVFERDTLECTKDVRTYLPVTEVTDSGVKLFHAITEFISESRKEREGDKQKA